MCRSVDLGSDRLARNRPQANISAMPKRGTKLDLGDRPEFDEAVQTDAVPPPPQAGATPPSRLASPIAEHVVKGLSLVKKIDGSGS